MDFDDGTPGLSLSEDIRGNLMREIQCKLPGNKVLLLQLGASKPWGTRAGMNVWDETTRTSSQLGTLNAYKISDFTLEFSVPLSRVQKFLSAGPLDTFVDVADAGDTGWNSGYLTCHLSVDFMK